MALLLIHQLPRESVYFLFGKSGLAGTLYFNLSYEVLVLLCLNLIIFQVTNLNLESTATHLSLTHRYWVCPCTCCASVMLIHLTACSLYSYLKGVLYKGKCCPELAEWKALRDQIFPTCSCPFFNPRQDTETQSCCWSWCCMHNSSMDEPGGYHEFQYNPGYKTSCRPSWAK